MRKTFETEHTRCTRRGLASPFRLGVWGSLFDPLVVFVTVIVVVVVGGDVDIA